MTTKKTFWTTTLALLVCGLVAGSFLGEQAAHEDRRLSHAAWAEVFDSPPALARGVDVVALVQPISVAPGRVAVSENGEDSLPFQLVEMEVLRGFRGVADSSRIVVERAGGVDLQSRSVFLDADGGDFEIGTPYLVFLKEQPGTGYYYQVNHQGRYAFERGHFRSADPDDRVAAHFHGTTFEQGVKRVTRALGEARTPARPNAK